MAQNFSLWALLKNHWRWVLVSTLAFLIIVVMSGLYIAGLAVVSETGSTAEDVIARSTALIYFTNLFALFVLISTAYLAWLTLRSNKDRECKTNSFKHIAEQTRDRELIEMFEEFRVVRKEVKNGNDNPLSIDHIVKIVIDHNGRALKAEDVIKKVFNYYEATALGIATDALDEDIIKRWWRTSFVLDWSDFSEYIRQKRKGRSDSPGNPKLYIELENLVKKWALPEERSKI
ncbi:DUF4760 domain-containing protein [Woodsholea maritima]|uniref:DUF4760 domain-containing protein n=1 Tax=Woodsholea maritima TaxID=240237 RepID=UPI00035E2608|nr:DUF4760 domain-containing protein [Woodsholea maritima]